jgi:hypothetical protein
MTATMILLALAAAGPKQAADTLPPYTESIRCAGLAEGAAAGASGEEERRLYDAAIFWGMAASEAARKAKLPGSRFTEDQLAAAAAAKTELAAEGAGAKAELAACLARVKPLKP